jgi:OPA family glycerol-3-phosphate transporter-like MFS transporter 3
LFHASRKTFSNVKTTISDTWTDSSLNKNRSNLLKPDSLWNTRSFFETKDEAKIFLGVLVLKSLNMI